MNINFEKSLSFKCPDLLEEWDYEKNAELGITPDDVLFSSKQKVYWKCKQGHSWKTGVVNRTSMHSSCPYCKGLKIKKGFNDLVTKEPLLMKEWDYEKNEGIDPTEIGAGSKIKAWWICPKGHSYSARILSRTTKLKRTGCPYCSGKKVMKGFNDMQTLRPDLMKYWDFDLNSFSPDEVTVHTSRRIAWKCDKCGHKWVTTGYTRAKYTIEGCPNCVRGKHTSYPEQFVYMSLHLMLQDRYAVYSRYKIDGVEADIFIPELKLAIEYDGMAFHNTSKTKKREEKKNKFFEDKGYILIRLKETEEKNKNRIVGNIIYLCKHANKIVLLSQVVKVLCDKIESLTGVHIDYYIPEDINEKILYNLGVLSKEKSLAALFPEIAKYFSVEKNGGLTADSISAQSHKSVWWVCPKCGSTYKMTVAMRTRYDKNNYVCLSCSKKIQAEKLAKPKIGVNDIITCCPDMLLDWDYEKNDALGIYPSGCAVNSKRKAFFKCHVCGKEWSNVIQKEKLRKMRGSVGCVECSKEARKKRNTTGVSDLENSGVA